MTNVIGWHIATNMEEVSWRRIFRGSKHSQLNPECKRSLKLNICGLYYILQILYKKTDAFYHFRMTPSEKDWFPERGIPNDPTVKLFQT